MLQRWSQYASLPRHLLALRCCFVGFVSLDSLCQQPSSAYKSDSLRDIRSRLSVVSLAESERSLLRYLQEYPASVEARFLLGYILFRGQRPKESLAEFTEGAKHQRPAANDLKTVASDYILLGDLVDAEKWLSIVTQEKPEDAEAWYLLGRTKYNENRFAEAITCFRRTLELQAGNVRAENNLGLSYLGLNQVDLGKAAFETAIGWQEGALSKDAQPYLNLGILLTDQGQPEKALFYLEQAVKLAAYNPKAHEELGRTYALLRMTSEARHELEQVECPACFVPVAKRELDEESVWDVGKSTNLSRW